MYGSWISRLKSGKLRGSFTSFFSFYCYRKYALVVAVSIIMAYPFIETTITDINFLMYLTIAWSLADR